jgi:hypothetical protein
MPGLAWSGELPFELKVAIAEAVTLFSRIDDMVIRVLWAGEMADLKRRKQIMKNRSFTNLEYLEAFVKAHLGGIEIPETWAALAALRQERNMIAHGVWGMSEGVPTVICMRRCWSRTSSRPQSYMTTYASSYSPTRR